MTMTIEIVTPQGVAYETDEIERVVVRRREESHVPGSEVAEEGDDGDGVGGGDECAEQEGGEDGAWLGDVLHDGAGELPDLQRIACNGQQP